MNSHTTITEGLLADKESKPIEASEPKPTKVWLNWQFIFNFLNTFSKTGYASAVIVTDILGLEAAYIDMSVVGMCASIPIAFLFALAEANSHYAESEHFNNSKSDINDNDPRVALTCYQKAYAGVHYLSDIFEGITMPLMVSKRFGIDNAPYWAKGLAYLGMGFWSTGGTTQELINAKVAFKEENKRELQKSMLP